MGSYYDKYPAPYNIRDKKKRGSGEKPVDGVVAPPQTATKPPGYDWAEMYPDYKGHPGEYTDEGVNRGLMSDRFYDQLKRQDMTVADSKFANGDYNVKAGQGSATHANADNRVVAQDELSQHQLDQMLASNSPLMQRAASRAMGRAGSRGLMNSSIAVGNAQGEMIDRAQPFALQDASAYGKTASENMEARNTAHLENARLGTEASLTNAQLRTQAGIAGMEAGGRRDVAALTAEQRENELIRKAMIDLETREDTQDWNTSESEAGRNWQTGERLGTEEFQEGENELNRIWTSGENEANRTRDWAVAEMQAYMSRGASREQAAMQVLSSIYSNPDMKASDQKAAAGNAMKIIRAEMGEGFGDFVSTLPPWMQEDVSAGEAETQTEPPRDDQGNVDYDSQPDWWGGGNDNFQMYWDALPASTRRQIWQAGNPQTFSANQKAGQSVSSNSNTQGAVVDASTPPV